MTRHQPRTHICCIRLCKQHVVLVRQRAPARLHGTGLVVANSLELPHRADPLEIAHMRTVCELHTLYVGVDEFEGERALHQGRRGA